MPGDSNISWTDKTWNPIAGCSIVSPGCTNCYAMQMAHRINRMKPDPASHYFGTTKVVNGNPVWTGVVNPAPDHILLAPLKWKKPARIFVNSMSDLFHEAVPDEVIDRVFAVMALCPQHTFQVLTKRSKRMRAYLTRDQHQQWGELRAAWFKSAELFCEDQAVPFHWLAGPYFRRMPLPNVHLGVSCEDQTRYDERKLDLMNTPAAVKFMSVEPMLSRIEMDWLPDWVVCGGESGPGHRLMQIEWAESIMRRCEESGDTAFFFKQDSGPRAGMKGRASDQLWACKQMPEVK